MLPPRLQGLSDKVTAVAWHPTRPQLLAYGCDGGALGTCHTASGIATPFAVRHKVRRCIWNISRNGVGSPILQCHIPLHLPL